MYDSPHPRKRFGQHFLIDRNILQKIVAAIHPTPQDHLVEIGPGHGALTEYLVPLAHRVDLIEIDRDLSVILQQHFADNNNIHIYCADALKFDLRQLTTDSTSLRLIGNLPYNISTPLLFKIFEFIDLIKDMHFMLQKEVVDRLTAPLGDHHYGRLTVMTRYYCHTEKLFVVGPRAFRPAPKVDSAVIRMIPQQQHAVRLQDKTIFTQVVREAFNHRRKTLRNALKTMVSSEIFATLDIDPNLRPQELEVEDFVRISNAITVI